MAFRTVELTGPAEIHVRNGALLVEKEIPNSKDVNKAGDTANKKTTLGKGTRKKYAAERLDTEKIKWMIPLEDILSIVCLGAGIRISTMAMAKICNHKISVMMLDEKYNPAGVLTAYDANARQALIMRKQAYADSKRVDRLWKDIILQKIRNQAQALRLLSLNGADDISKYERTLSYSEDNEFLIDPVEAGAAKQYFHYLCPEISRREETPINSCLNYGYSIIRNTIIRNLITAGLLPAFGLHHQNLYNAFNLADDLIEPFRPCVDIVAYSVAGVSTQLDRSQRRRLAEVVLHAVQIKGKKVNIITAIGMMVDDLRSFYNGDNEEIALPSILPVEKIDTVRE